MNGSLIAVEQCRLLAGDPIISAVKLCSSLHCILYGLRDRNKSVRSAVEAILPSYWRIADRFCEVSREVSAVD